LVNSIAVRSTFSTIVVFKEPINLPTGQSVQTVQQAQNAKLFSPVGAALSSLNGMVGVGCNPIAGFIGANGVNWYDD
jgi:uncharacterized surface protein with fasciclin (FAS1) repeats